MSEARSKLPRRFFTLAETAAAPEGHVVLLDGRPLRTPAGAVLHLPSPALGERVAAEWRAQELVIELTAMPATRLAFTALDRVRLAAGDVVEEIVRYGDNDLLCHRADRPRRLVERQAAAYGPLLAWAASALGAPLEVRRGLVARPQPEQALAALRLQADGLDLFALAGVAAAASLFSSAVLAFALRARRLDGAEALDLSRLEERHQEEEWGVDAEAAARTKTLITDARALEAWFLALGDDRRDPQEGVRPQAAR